MNAGVSGMKGFQTKLDVIGNNIANVSTVGFKKGRVTFQDMMSQTTSNAQGPIDGSRGGMNAKQIGLGSQLGTIDNIHTQGFRETTDVPLDLQLEGDGMFVVKLDDSDEEFYTRAGNFGLDTDGYIVNADGYYLQSMDGDKIQIEENVESYSIATDGTVNIVDEDGESRSVGQIAIQLFSNPGGLEQTGNSLYRSTPNAGRVDGVQAAGSGGVASIVSGALEMSNVDLAAEFTEMITAQRGFQANTRIITTSDEILQELVNLKR